MLSGAGAARATPNIGVSAETKGQVFTTATNSASYAHSVPSTGSNRALIVTIGTTAGAAPVADVGTVVWKPDTTMSGGTQTLTCPAALDQIMGTSRRIVICTLLNPTTSSGHGQITITLASGATDTFTSSATTMTGVASFGTATGSPADRTFGNWAACTGTTSFICSLTVATVVDEVLFDLVGQGEPTDDTTRSYATGGTGQNKHEDSASLVTGNNNRVATSVTIATSTSTTLKWTFGNSTSSNGVGQVVLTISAASSVTAAALGGLGAVRYGAAGTRVVWRTEEEVSHLGFQVWREVNGARARLAGGMLPGSMFATGDYPLAGRRQYEIWDPSPAAGAHYWLEEIATTGPSRWYGPVVPAAGNPTRGSALRLAPGPRSPSVTGRFALSSLDEPAAAPAGPPRSERTFPVARNRDLARSEPLAPDPTCANPPAWSPSIKIGVSATGWIRIDAAALFAAGLSADADPARLGLYADGKPVAMEVDGQPRVAAIEFYGTGLDTRETATHIYWLVADDPHPLRVATAERQRAGPLASSYLAEVELRERKIYFAALLNGPADNFFGATISDATVTQTLDLSAPVTGEGAVATLEVALQGATLDAHSVQVSLAGVALGTLSWAGRALDVQTFDVPAGILHAGVNDVLLTPLGGAGDISLVQHVSLAYPRLFEASGETLAAMIPGGGSASLAGFTSSDVRVVDLSDPTTPLELPVETSVASDGSFQARVSVAAGAVDHPVLAFTPTGLSSADYVTANHPSALCATRGGELAVIAPASFFAALAPLVAARAAEGWSVDLIDVEDAYDEMSYGMHTAAALTSFVRKRRQGTASPRTRYLLLVGDASLDPRNLLGKDVPDIVPTTFIDTSTIETASDDALADLDGDGVPELAVGRWPARTPDEVAGFVTRTLQVGPATPFARGSLVVAGASAGFDFTNTAERVLAAAPGTGHFLNANGMAFDAARATLASLWSEGPSFVAYLGHGSQGVWEGLMSMDDLSGTDPVGAPAIVAAMTCLNGFFHDVYQDCLAERLMRAQNGAAAVWASSSLEDAGAQGQLVLAFEDALRTTALGEAARQTKAALPGMGSAMVLFGDPTLFGGPTPDVANTALTSATAGPLPSGDAPSSSTGLTASTSRPSALDDGLSTSARSGCDVSGAEGASSVGGSILGLALALPALARRRAARR